MIKKIIKNLLSFFKLKLVKISNNQNFPIEAKIEIKKFINLSSKFSMTGEKRMYLLTYLYHYFQCSHMVFIIPPRT